MPQPPARQPETGKIPFSHIIAAACFSIQAIGIGTQICFGVFFIPLMAEFGWSRAIISGASSVAFLVMGILGIGVGHMNDRFGPRIQMTVTAALMGLGCILMAKLAAIWQLYLFYGIIFGAGQSAIDVISLTTIARWFSRNRGMVTGIVKAGTGAGQLIMPLLAGMLIANVGWRSAYALIGLVAAGLLILIAQALKRDPGRRAPLPGQPRAVGTAAEDATGSISFEAALGTLSLWVLCLLNLTLVFCLMIIIVHIVPHARDIGLPAPLAAGVLSTIGGVSMLGRFASGMAIDRIGSRSVMIFCFLLLIADLLWIQLAGAPWQLFLFAAVYGLAHGGFFTAISPIVAELFGIGAHGSLFGMVACFGTIGGSIGPFLAGFLFDRTGSYSVVFWLITAMAAAGLCLILYLKPGQRAQ